MGTNISRFIKKEGSVCRNDSRIIHTDKTKETPKLQLNIQCIKETKELISNSQKLKEASITGMGGHLAPEWGGRIDRNIHYISEKLLLSLICKI